MQNLARYGGAPFPEADASETEHPADIERQQQHQQHSGGITLTAGGMEQHQRGYFSSNDTPFAVPSTHPNDRSAGGSGNHTQPAMWPQNFANNQSYHSQGLEMPHARGPVAANENRYGTSIHNQRNTLSRGMPDNRTKQ